MEPYALTWHVVGVLSALVPAAMAQAQTTTTLYAGNGGTAYSWNHSAAIATGTGLTVDLTLGIEYLAVGGGGGGGGGIPGGGGGGGGVLIGTFGRAPQTFANPFYRLNNAGAGGVNGGSTATNGGDVVVFGLTAFGGGAGAGGATAKSGGSGGGGTTDGSYRVGGSGTAGQGFAGGTGGAYGSFGTGAGGGGAASSGTNANAAGAGRGGAGGAGVVSTITGASATYGSGGGGGGSQGGGSTSSGGGAGASSGNGASGTAGFGGGGGGAYGGNGGTGGTGAAIWRYLSSTSLFSVVPASSQISVNGQTYRLHNLTASGEYNNVALSYSISNLFATQSTAITGTGRLTFNSAGTLILTASNTYTGSTTISAGTLQVGMSGTTGVLGPGTVTNNATLAFSRSDAVTFADAIIGSGSLVQRGSGVLTLTATNTYAGTTTISSGTLQVGDGGTVGTLGSGTVVNNAALVFNRSDSLTAANAISGSGSLTTLLSGTVTLSGSNSYTGGTTVSAGRLVGTTSSLQGTLANNAAVTFDQSTSGTYAGSMAGSGSLVKSGVGTVTFSGSNALAGGLSLSAGTLAVGSVNGLGSSGTISFGGGTLQYTANNATDYSSRFSNDAGQAYSIDTNGRNVTLAAALTSSGGVLTKSGAGTLTLTAANTYSGVTTIADGTLSVGDGGTVGDLGGSGTITNIGALAINRSNAVSLGRGITGAGAFWQLGTGTTTLTGINSYSGGTVVSAGQLVGTTDSLQGGITNNAAVEFAQAASGNYAGNMGGSGSLTKSGAGAVTLTGSNAYSGGTTISAGALAVAAIADAGASNIGTSGPLTLSGGTLDYTGSAAATTARVVDISAASTTSTIGVAAAAGRLTLTGKVWNSGTAHPNVVLNKTGAGTLEIAGAGSNVGTSLVVQSGTVVLNATQRAVYEVRGLDAGATLQLGRSDQIFSGDAISTTGNIRMTGGTLDLNGFNETVNRVSGADFTTTGTGVITSAAPATLTFGNNLAGRPSRFAGTITGSVAINVKGTNPVTLSGENTYSGSTTIQDAGTQLRIGVGGTTGSLGTGAVTNGGELVFDRSDSVTVANAISGSGSVVQAGAGTTTLTGANSYAGTTTIAAGRLVGTTSSLPGAIANASQLEFAQAAAGTFAAAISGTGSFTKTGGGNLILSGSSSYSGATSVAAGRLSVNGILGDTPVAVLAAAELGGSGSIAGPVSIAAGGSLAPGNSIASLATGTASFAAAATFAYEVDSTNPLSLGSAADLLVVSGDLNLDSGNASLLTLADLASSVQPFVEDTTIFAMINYSGDWNGGLFTYGGNVLSDGERFYAGSQMWEIDYNRTSSAGLDNFTADYLPSSSFVTVTAVPEPSTLVLMAIGAGVAAVAARQRHASGRHCRTGG